MYQKLCEELDVEYKTIGSLLIAREESDIVKLTALEARAKENGVSVKILNKQETLKKEPNLNPDIAGSALCPECGNC